MVGGVASFGRPRPPEPEVAPPAVPDLGQASMELVMRPVIDREALDAVALQIAEAVRRAVIAGVKDGFADAAWEMEQQQADA